MVTKNQIKLVKSLQQKKYRSQHKLFVVEGKKAVFELIDAGLEPFQLFVDTKMDSQNYNDFDLIPSADLEKMSSLSTPNGVLGVFHIPDAKPTESGDWAIALDNVRDPGNLGTIIRLCDWFGIHHLICSMGTVDCYNPKVLQATMGSVARVNIVYTDLAKYLRETEKTVYGAFMDGNSVYSEELPKKGILVMGNEANGISQEIQTVIAQRIAIPQFGKNTTESLNVATATAILLNEIRRGG